MGRKHTHHPVYASLFYRRREDTIIDAKRKPVA